MTYTPEQYLIDECDIEVQKYINQLEHQNAELTKERDELLAHCEELRLNLGWYIETLDTVENLYNTPKQNALRNRAFKAFKASPQQSLANIQTDAIEKMIDTIESSCETANGDDAYSASKIYDYANQLREQRK